MVQIFELKKTPAKGERFDVAIVPTEEIRQLTREFDSCQRLLTALGDQNRQHLIIEMLKLGKCDGVRVGEITECTHLSRPAVSHHLRILKEAGIVKIRREGTKNYYYFDFESGVMDELIKMLVHARNVVRSLREESD